MQALRKRYGSSMRRASFRRLAVAASAFATTLLGCGAEQLERADESPRAHGDVDACLIPACAELDPLRPELIPRRPYPKHPLRLPSERDADGTLRPWIMQVKFADAAQVRVDDRDGVGGLRSRSGADLDAVRAVAADEQLRFRSATQHSPGDLAALEARAAERSGRAQPDLAGLVVVELDAPRERWKVVGERLQALDTVEFVSVFAPDAPPPEDLPPTTPDLVDNLAHFGPNPGIDVTGAWALGLSGEGVRLADIELAWDPSHEDLVDGMIVAEPGQTPTEGALEHVGHGTAVIGITSAVANGYGITGAAWSAPMHTYPELTVEGGARRYDAILSAVMDSAVGDLVILELQVSGATGVIEDYVPAEYVPAIHMASKVGTDAGVLLIATSGNGDQDLDGPLYEGYRDMGDSGVLMVGAGSPNLQHDRLSFSTYGSRVNVQGWGANVFTLGYSNFAAYGDDPRQTYTDAFNGTSSAAPVVASAVALIQEHARTLGGELGPYPMRELLVLSGIPQGSGGHIGPLPNTLAAVGALGSVDDVEGPVVAIVTPGPGPDVWSAESPFVTDIEIEATDETLIERVHIDIAGAEQPWVGLTPPYVIEDVGFPEGEWTVQARAIDIWGNEGASETLIVHVGQEPPTDTETTETDDGVESIDETDTDTDTGTSAAAGTSSGCSLSAGGRTGKLSILALGLLLGFTRRRTGSR